jgi:hypothetical protein
MITTFTNNIPVAATGFGLESNHYVSGRISAAVAKHGGLGAIRFHGQQQIKKSLFFQAPDVSSWSKLARVQILIDGEAYYPEFNQTRHYPFGYASECCLANVNLRHELILDQDTLFQRIVVLENPDKAEIRARLLLHGHLWAATAGRTVDEWIIDPASGALSSTVTDKEPDACLTSTTVLIGSTVKCNTTVRNKTFKYYMETDAPADEMIFHVAFNPKTDSMPASERLGAMCRNYELSLADGLHFETGNPALDSALSNAAPTVARLALADCPGAIRASQNYWVWGWDSMVHSEALLWSGNTELVREMLVFYRETADAENGIAHSFNSDLTYHKPHRMADNAQMLYVVMLHNYYAATGDLETLQNCLEFARLILKRAAATVGNYGSLGVGFGFFPDDRWSLGHNRRDLSLINNSLYFQGLRAMAELEGKLGHGSEAMACVLDAGKVKKGLETILWDAEANYWFDSASADDGTPRRHHPLYGQLYVSGFGTEPHSEKTDDIAEFMRQNFLFEAGLYMFPKTDDGFMADGNQLGAYYPPIDRYYWNVMNRVGDSRALADFERIVTGFWRQHTYPEGLTHETANAEPTLDKPGCKQAFSAKAWLCDALELHLGLRVNLQGFSLNPMPAEQAFRVENLMLRGKRIVIERIGNGRTPQFTLNGTVLEQGYVSWDMLQSKNTLTIEMS